MHAQQKASGEKITVEEKREALSKIENKTTEEAERELHTLFPEAAVATEKIINHRDGGHGLFVQLTFEEAKELERA